METSEFLPLPSEQERAAAPLLGKTAVKALVRHRDGYRCRLCRITAEDHVKLTGRTLDVHRIVPGSAYTLDGCVTLCQKCHGPMPKSKRQTAQMQRRIVPPSLRGVPISPFPAQDSPLQNAPDYAENHARIGIRDAKKFAPSMGFMIPHQVWQIIRPGFPNAGLNAGDILYTAYAFDKFLHTPNSNRVVADIDGVGVVVADYFEADNLLKNRFPGDSWEHRLRMSEDGFLMDCVFGAVLAIERSE